MGSWGLDSMLFNGWGACLGIVGVVKIEGLRDYAQPRLVLQVILGELCC
ncbi:hypothetical protein ADIS_0354 [Lunatimonas lonarensis]|uniref:Uncharacterized protein n=1 Tax=Lunatimonas lonarensis TaxID=1232681 RepID=R7ZYG9_9BACT|nr:hypothetical protein ADIS_0354 [Lunatimonas lonarensis]